RGPGVVELGASEDVRQIAGRAAAALEGEPAALEGIHQVADVLADTVLEVVGDGQADLREVPSFGAVPVAGLAHRSAAGGRRRRGVERQLEPGAGPGGVLRGRLLGVLGPPAGLVVGHALGSGPLVYPVDRARE